MDTLILCNAFVLVNYMINNCIAKMEVGCLRHPGASTIGSQLLDEDCSHGWQILATQPWAPSQQQGQAPVTLLKQWKEGGTGVGGELPGRWAATAKIARKCLLYLCHATPHYATLQSTSTWNSDTCAYVSTPQTTRGMQALFVVNSVK